MLGCVVWGEERRPRVERAAWGPVVVALLTLPRQVWGGEKRRQRCWAAGARLLRAQGVRTALFPRMPVMKEVFRREGVRPVDPAPLRRALVGPVALARMEAGGFLPEGTLALTAERVTEEVQAAAEAAAPRCRYLLLDTGAGTEALARSLRRRWGVAPGLFPTAAALDRAQGLAAFSYRRDLKGRNPVIAASAAGMEAFWPPLAVPAELRRHFPEELEEAPLAAALWHRGLLRFEDILGEIVG